MKLKQWTVLKKKLQTVHPRIRIQELLQIISRTKDRKIQKEAQELSNKASIELDSEKPWSSAGTNGNGALLEIMVEEATEQPEENLEESVSSVFINQEENSEEFKYSESEDYSGKYESKKYESDRSKFAGGKGESKIYTRKVKQFEAFVHKNPNQMTVKETLINEDSDKKYTEQDSSEY